MSAIVPETSIHMVPELEQPANSSLSRFTALSSVVLPEPDGPMIMVIELPGISKSMPFRTVLPKKATLKFAMDMTGVCMFTLQAPNDV